MDTLRHTRRLENRDVLPRSNPTSNEADSRAHSRYKEKKTLSGDPTRVSELNYVTANILHPGCRMLTTFSFKKQAPKILIVRNLLSLRIDYAMANRSSHGTLPHFGLQRFQLNIHY